MTRVLKNVDAGYHKGGAEGLPEQEGGRHPEKVTDYIHGSDCTGHEKHRDLSAEEDDNHHEHGEEGKHNLVGKSCETASQAHEGMQDGKSQDYIHIG